MRSEGEKKKLRKSGKGERVKTSEKSKIKEEKEIKNEEGKI
jgi:hypothetical protein